MHNYTAESLSDYICAGMSYSGTPSVMYSLDAVTVDGPQPARARAKVGPRHVSAENFKLNVKPMTLLTHFNVENM